MHETLNRSALAQFTIGSAVNLERAMPANGRFGGHIVAGHVDGVGRIANIRKDDTSIWYTIHADPAILRYVVEKGSITIDGISLTVAAVEPCLLYTSHRNRGAYRNKAPTYAFRALKSPIFQGFSRIVGGVCECFILSPP